MSKIYPYSAELAELLANPPETGAGRHHWLFEVAAKLIRQGADPEEVRLRLEKLAFDLGWHDRIKQIRTDIAKILSQPEYRKPERRMRLPDACEAERFLRFSHPPLFPASPAGVSTRDALAALYRPGELICVSKDTFSATVQRLEDILDIAPSLEFIVANPMRSEHGRTGTGEISARTKANATTDAARRYVILEFDTRETVEEQAAVLSSISTPAAPLVMAVHSGGKSVHGWYYVKNISMSQRECLFMFGAYLGADRSLWDPCKLVRMPGGTRVNGAKQEILYADFKHIT